MRKLPYKSGSSIVLTTATLLLSVFLFSSSPTQADTNTSHVAVVSEFASFNTPGAIDGRVEAIAVDGDTVYVGGTFTQIQNPLSNEIIDRPYLFAYSKSSGNIIDTFDPQLNGSVLALETTGEAAGGVFAGGVFGNLNGETSRGRFAKIGIDGERIGGFSGRVNGSVNTMVRHGNALYIGGTFDAINGIPVENLAELDAATGIVDPSLNFDFDGTITTTTTPNGVQGVQNIDITSDGRLLAVNGNFLEIAGQSRPRLALLELDGQARVSTWNTNVFDGDCPSGRFPNYILGIDISPDDSYLLTASSGFRRRGEPNCDTTVRFELDDLTDDDVQPTWVNYTGGDSVYDVLSTEHAVYIGGHFEFLNNDLGGGNFGGRGSQARRGLAALDPINGLTLLDWRSDRNPRGLGVFAILSEPEGIYLGDDTDFLNGSEHKKFKFLPVSDDVVERPQVPSLPTTMLINDLPNRSLYSRSFDGSIIGAQVALQDHTFGADVVGAILADDQLFHFRNNDSVLVSTLSDGAFEAFDEVDLFGLTGNEWAISQIGGIFFDHNLGRVYYTLQGDSQLYWRAFTPASPYFGNDEYVAEQQSDILWSDVTGMDVIDGHLYFTRSDRTLYRAQVEGYEPITGTTQAISGSTIDGHSWNVSFLTFGTLSADNTGGNSGTAEFEFENSGSQTVRTNRNFEFPVQPGVPTMVRLSWLDENAELHLRIRDANGDLVASDLTRAGSPKWLSVPAGDGGTYTASVQIAEGATSYTLQINPDEEPPEPLADFVFISTGSASDGRFQRFDFEVNAGELIEAGLTYDISDADIALTLRDESNTLVERDNGQNGAATLSLVAESSGVWSVVVLVDNADDVDYDVLVDTFTDFVLPEPLADFEFSSSGFTDNNRFQRFDFEVNAGELIEARVNYDAPGAVVRFDLRDETNTLIEREDGIDGAAMLSTVAESSGVWSAVVRVDNDVEVNYGVLIDTLTDFVLPEPLADFEFSSSGFTNSGRFQRFDFEVNAGELIEASVNYDVPGAVVRFDLRDETNTLIEREDGIDGAAMLSTVAESSGVWSAVVRVDNDVEVNYGVLIDTLTEFVLPDPLADFEFSSSGFTDSGRFQRFDFAVNAGELIEASMNYDAPGAVVRFDLRDETNSLIKRGDGVDGTAMLSTVAESSGVWSAVVRVDNDVEVNYGVLIDTLTDFVLPDPLADFEFSSSGFTDSGRFQRFDFEVNAGERIEAGLAYDVPDAEVRFDLRDETNTLIERQTGVAGFAMLSTVAETSGVWSAVVRVDNDVEVNYDILVDTIAELPLTTQ